VTITEEKGYPPLLFAAAKSGNELAVRLLIENGATPNAKFRGRYAM
jgi:ankyrin repeat protein